MQRSAIGIAAMIAWEATAFVALPFWLIVRIIDYIFGGPMRRARLRQD